MILGLLVSFPSYPSISSRILLRGNLIFVRLLGTKGQSIIGTIVLDMIRLSVWNHLISLLPSIEFGDYLYFFFGSAFESIYLRSHSLLSIEEKTDLYIRQSSNFS